MKHTFLRRAAWCAAFLLSGLLTSCYNNIEAVDEAVSASVGTSISVDVCQNVWTEKATKATDGVQGVTLPLRYYLFNSSKKCIAIQTVTDAGVGTGITFADVSAGKYSVYAVCGYEQPLTSVGSTITTTTLLLADEPTADICIGSKSITVSSSLDSTIMITAAHVYARLQLTLSDVPATVDSITASITPLYQGFAWNGKGANASNTTYVSRSFTLSKEAETQWSSNQMLLPPSSGNVTIVLTLKYQDGKTERLTSEAGTALKAGTALMLTSTYPQVRSAIGANVAVQAWTSDTLAIDFQRQSGDDQSSDETSTPTTPDASTPSEPESTTYAFGEQYGTTQAMVVRQEGNNLLIMGTFKDDYIATSGVSSAYSTYVGCQASWRIPTLEEWRYIVEQFGENYKQFNQTVAKIYPGLSAVFNGDYIAVATVNNNIQYYQFGSVGATSDFESRLSSDADSEVYYYPVATVALP